MQNFDIVVLWITEINTLKLNITTVFVLRNDIAWFCHWSIHEFFNTVTCSVDLENWSQIQCQLDNMSDGHH